MPAFDIQAHWTPETNYVFAESDKYLDWHTFPVTQKPCKFHFKNCETVSFFDGDNFLGGAPMGTGCADVPAGIKVVVKNGYAKVEEI